MGDKILIMDVDPGGFLATAVAACAPPAPLPPSTTPELAGRIDELRSRVELLESRRSAAARRAIRDLRHSTRSWRLRWVPSDYYSRTMEARSRLLCCEVPQMCKSVLLENKLWKGSDEYEPTNARHYLVVVQYAATLSEAKLRAALAAKSGLAKSAFNFRFATAEANATLTGFEPGAVTPFGMLEPRIPVVLAEAATKAPRRVVWMGGGHRDLKIGCGIDDFIRRFEPLVLDASEPRRDKPDNEMSPEDDAAARLAIIVGRIVDVWPHPDSEKLFCENVDCGPHFGLRPIASGLRQHFDQTHLDQRCVLIVANLKPRKLAGFVSRGMVLCAVQDDNTVALVSPPSDAQPGDRVRIQGLPDSPPASETQCDKAKLFATAQPYFAVRRNVVCYKDRPFEVLGRTGSCTAQVRDGSVVS